MNKEPKTLCEAQKQAREVGRIFLEELGVFRFIDWLEGMIGRVDKKSR